MEAWLGIVGSVVLAVLAFAFGRANVNRQSEVQRDEDLRRVRLERFAALCEGIIEYRRAQLHRWFVGNDIGTADEVERTRPDVAEDARKSRAAVDTGSHPGPRAPRGANRPLRLTHG